MRVVSDLKKKPFHWHLNENGLLVKCYHASRLPVVSFCLGMTFGFPVEHLLWERVPPFCWLTKWLGL